MLAISRFESVDQQLEAGLQSVAEYWRGCPGCLAVDVVVNLDQPDLWALISRWEDVGSYRRSFGGYDAKMLLTPVLLRAIDEPSAYLGPDELVKWGHALG